VKKRPSEEGGRSFILFSCLKRSSGQLRAGMLKGNQGREKKTNFFVLLSPGNGGRLWRMCGKITKKKRVEEGRVLRGGGGKTTAFWYLGGGLGRRNFPNFKQKGHGGKRNNVGLTKALEERRNRTVDMRRGFDSTVPRRRKTFH